MSAAEEMALLRRAGSGEEPALAALYQTYSRTLFGFACRLGGSVSAAEDLVQE
ncbi:MAG: hypothetical protein FJW20_22995 [Acidimicrobiia bacterium]|nr:hypothetical protein [Acidimicrobiia bacterium]